eukprot:UN32263
MVSMFERKDLKYSGDFYYGSELVNITKPEEYKGKVFLTEKHLKELKENHVTILDDVCDAKLIQKVRGELTDLLKHGDFGGFEDQKEVRSDILTWIKSCPTAELVKKVKNLV